jgi:hypothetical protein
LASMGRFFVCDVYSKSLSVGTFKLDSGPDFTTISCDYLESPSALDSLTRENMRHFCEKVKLFICGIVSYSSR